jgi:nitrate/TMAO reductase-like tetraheme cytochrome c subunit
LPSDILPGTDIRLRGAWLDQTLTVIMGILFLVALASGMLTWVSRNVWLSLPRTRLFAVITVISTLTFVGIAMVVLP